MKSSEHPTRTTNDRLLKRGEVLDCVNVSNATLWRWVKKGRFPAPVQTGPRAVRWRESQVSAWVSALKAAA